MIGSLYGSRHRDLEYEGFHGGSICLLMGFPIECCGQRGSEIGGSWATGNRGEGCADDDGSMVRDEASIQRQMIELEGSGDDGHGGKEVAEDVFGEDVIDPRCGVTSDMSDNGGRRVEGDQSMEWRIPLRLLESCSEVMTTSIGFADGSIEIPQDESTSAGIGLSGPMVRSDHEVLEGRVQRLGW